MYLANRKKGAGYWAVACQTAFFIAILPIHAEDTTLQETIAAEQSVSSGVEEPRITGKAFYYKKHYKNRKTASGAIYDPRKMTAAHPEIPLGTQVEVVNLANKKAVVVTVNDRCRKRGFEIIDVSRAAARKLGFLGKGVAQVQIIPIEK